MRLKKILLVFMLIFLTGCSTEYTLTVSNDSFKENIDVVIPKDIIPIETQEIIDAGIEIDDQITPFIKDKTASLITNDKYYKKKYIEYDDYYSINMKYTYNEENFKNSNSVNLCFEYPELDFSENYYINLQGKFYCLYSDSVDIKINTKNKVYYNNADEIDGNTYIWHINESNVDYVDIKIEIDKGISKTIFVYIGVAIVLLIAILFVVYKVFMKSRENNKI